MISMKQKLQLQLIQAAAIISAMAGPLAPAAAQPDAVPPPQAQTGADCTRPQYASDMLVCADPELRSTDAALAALAQAQPHSASNEYWEDQFAWLRRRSRCAFAPDHRACLVAAYADRRALLTAATATANRRLTCNGPWRGRSLLASTGPALAIRSDGALLAVATPASGPWQPWLALRQAGRRLTLQPQQGPSLRCNLG